MQQFTIPLRTQLNYLKYILTNRKEDTDASFNTPIFPGEMSSYEIGFHAISALWVNALRFDPDQPAVTKLETKKEDFGVHLLELYELALQQFENTCNKLDDSSLKEIIPSPVSGRDTVKSVWFWTTVMHTIHHMGQSFRLQGIVQNHKI